MILANQKGFSLIEVIVTLVLIAIVGAMVVSYMGTTTRQTGKTLTWLSDEFELSQVMERIVADYREELNSAPPNWATFFGSRDTVGEINTRYGADIDDVEVEPTAFQADPSPSTDYTESGTDNSVQKVTLKKGEQTLITLFTE